MEEERFGKAFVCSSLPIKFLNDNIIKWNIDLILLNNSIHVNTYFHLKKFHPTLKIKVLPGGFLKNLIFLTFFFLRIKIKKQNLYFFHECCAVLFDLLIQFFRPKAFYYPQVTLDSFPLKKDKSFLSKEGFLTSFFLQFRNFQCFIHNHYNNPNEHGIIWSIMKYNKNVKVFKIQDSKIIKKSNNNNKVLILISKDIFSDKDMIGLLNKVTEILKIKGLKVYIKNHPNSSDRLKFENISVTEIDPSMPFELIDNNFIFTISFFSTALLRTDKNSISLSYLVKDKPLSFSYRVSHLVDHPNYSSIFFPKTFDDLNQYLNEHL